MDTHVAGYLLGSGLQAVLGERYRLVCACVVPRLGRFPCECSWQVLTVAQAISDKIGGGVHDRYEGSMCMLSDEMALFQCAWQDCSMSANTFLSRIASSVTLLNDNQLRGIVRAHIFSVESNFHQRGRYSESESTYELDPRDRCKSRRRCRTV